MSSSRILLPFVSGALPEHHGSALFLGAEFDSELKAFDDLDCIQNHRPEFDRLTANGFTCITQQDRTYDLAMLTLTRYRAQNRMRFAKAWSSTRNGGLILVSGNKTDGIDAFLKEINRMIPVTSRLSKSHGKVFWLTKTTSAPDCIVDWLKLAEPQKNKDGFFTAPGLFSADAIDPGSKCLTDIFGPKLKGIGADLGSGWGYLSKAALAASEKIERLDLYEANFDAVTAAKMNVSDERAEFYWSDAMALPAKQQYNFVISNPPFHESRKSEPQVGQSFLQMSAKILKPKGTLYMVANRHLPYEATLNACFKRVEKVSETPHFKVFIASAPQSGKP